MRIGQDVCSNSSKKWPKILLIIQDTGMIYIMGFRAEEYDPDC